jgi:hypothetical protein
VTGIVIRDIPENILERLEKQAAAQNVSREEFIRRLFFTSSFTGTESTLWHLRNEINQRLILQLEKNNELLETIKAALEEVGNG